MARRGALLALGLVVAAAAVTACTPVKGSPRGPRIMLVGDSVAHNLVDPLRSAFGARGQAFEPAAQPGCGIVRGVISDFQGGFHELPNAWDCDAAIWGVHDEKLNRFRPDIVVWLGIIEIVPRYVDDGWYAPGPWPLPSPNVLGHPGISGVQGDAKLLALIDEKRAQFTAGGARVVFLTTPPPIPTHDLRDQRTAHLNTLLEQFVLAHPGDTTLVDFAAMVCPPVGKPPCPSVVDGVVLRPDGFHFGPEGAAWATARLLSLIGG